MKKGDWIEGYGGIGIIEDIRPYYYQEWERRKLPEGTKVGDKAYDRIIMKRLCNYNYKKSFQRTSFNADLSNKITKKSMEEVSSLLADKKTKERYEKYKGKEIGLMVWFDYTLPKVSVNIIKEFIDSLNTDNELGKTYQDLIEVFLNECSVDLKDTSTPLEANISIGLYNKEFINIDKDLIFANLKYINKEPAKINKNA